jgi:O-antigen/teichoic acid export membrane protein
MSISTAMRSVACGLTLPSGLARLVGSGLLVQVLTAANYPIMSRLYGPADLGEFAVYANTLGLLAIVVCLRLDAAIALQQDRRTAAELGLLGFSATVVIAILTSALLFAGALQWLFGRFGTTDRALVALLPFSILALGLVQTVRALALYERLYTELGRSQLIQCIMQLTTQIAGGIGQLGSLGLALAFVTGQTVGYGSAVRQLRRDYSTALRGVRIGRLRATLRAASAFCRYSVPSAVLYAAIMMVPPLVIFAYCGSEVAGIFFLTAQLLSQCFSVVRRSSAQYVIGEGRFIDRARYLRAGRRLRAAVVAGAVGCVIGSATLALIGTTLSGVLLGPQWERVGLFAAILLPMFAWDLVGYVYTQVLVVRQRYRLQLMLDLMRAVVVIGGLVALLEAGSTAVTAALWLSASLCAFYAAVVYIGHRELMHERSPRADDALCDVDG